MKDLCVEVETELAWQYYKCDNIPQLLNIIKTPKFFNHAAIYESSVLCMYITAIISRGYDIDNCFSLEGYDISYSLYYTNISDILERLGYHQFALNYSISPLNVTHNNKDN